MTLQARSESVRNQEQVPPHTMDTDRSAWTWMGTDRSAWTVATDATEFHSDVGSYFVTVTTGCDKQDQLLQPTVEVHYLYLLLPG
jgi:hypothetical protein